MKKIQYLGSFFIAFILGVFVMYNFGDFDVANSIVNRKNKDNEYNYEEQETMWNSEEEYLKYLKKYLLR